MNCSKKARLRRKRAYYLPSVVSIRTLDLVDGIALLVKGPLCLGDIKCLTSFLALEVGRLISKRSWFLWLDLKQKVEEGQMLIVLLSYLVTTVITTIGLLMRGPIGIMRSSVGLFRSAVT